MMIYLTHPLHGAKHAYSEPEAVADEKNGWVRQIETLVETFERTNFSERYEAKFGKKPHHRMAQSTIEAALKE